MEIASDGRTLRLDGGAVLSRGPDYMSPQEYEWRGGRGCFLAARQAGDAIECLFEDAEGEPFIVLAADLVEVRLVDVEPTEAQLEAMNNADSGPSDRAYRDAMHDAGRGGLLS